MKTLMLFLTVTSLLPLPGFAQGTLLFANTSTTRIYDLITREPVPTGIYTVGLYAGPTGSREDELTLRAITGIASAEIFRGLFNGGIVSLEGITGAAVFQVKAWNNTFATYEEAISSGAGGICVGNSAVLSIPLGDGGIILPGDIVADGGFQGFYVCFPEPSTVAVGFLGGLGALILHHRRRPRR